MTITDLLFGRTDYQILYELAAEKLRSDFPASKLPEPLLAKLQSELKRTEIHESTVKGFERLSRRLRFSVCPLPWDIPLGQLFSFSRTELGSRADDSWAKLKVVEVEVERIEPFCYHLMEVFEKHCDHRKVRDSLASIGIEPRSEDEWIDWLNTLTLAEFARLLDDNPRS